MISFHHYTRLLSMKLAEKINQGKSMVLNDQIAWSRQSGVPFMLVASSPSEQLYIKTKLEEIEQEGKTQGYKVEVINLEKLLYKLLLEDENGDLTELYEFEKEDYPEFMKE